MRRIVLDTDVASLSFKNGWTAGSPVLHSTDDIVTVWGEISAYAEQRGRPRPQNDSWVAACCLAYGLPLATLNVKDFQDFQDFAEHEGLRLVGS